MVDLIDMLPKAIEDGEEYYTDAGIRRHATHVIDLDGGGMLAVHEDLDGLHVSFVVLSMFRGQASPYESEADGALWDHVFHGVGPSGALRELRHTFWGEGDNGGYIFYPNAKLIADAFVKLSKWFDCD